MELTNPDERSRCRLEEYVSTRNTPFERPPGLAWIGPTSVKAFTDIPVHQSGAQFLVPGFEASWDPHTHEGHFSELCGPLSVGAILGLSAHDAVDAYVRYATRLGTWDETEGTFADDLAGFVNDEYGDAWRATVHSLTSHPAAWLRSWLTSNAYVIAQVQIRSGSRFDDRGGDVLASGQVDHWVATTGYSSRWSDAEDSIWNWVRIFNPFTNWTEYYQWYSEERLGQQLRASGFREAWRLAGRDDNYLSVTIARNASRRKHEPLE